MAQRGVLVFQKAHNIRAFLNPDAPGMRPYKEMMEFLFRSRIFKAINEDVIVFRSHQEDFWNTACVDSTKNPRKITAKVSEHDIVITEEILRRILGFGDSQGEPTVLNKEKVRGCLVRCGYPAERGIVEGTVYKKFFCPPFKYLAHIMIHCLGSRKSGFDQMSQILQNAYVALVLNMPFNFSRMIFDYMVEVCLGKKEEFLLYPRFLQMVLNEQAPDFQGSEGDILPIEHMRDYTVRSMKDYSKKQVRPRDRRLFGHLIDIDYRCPPGDLWRNEDSESDSENIIVSQAGTSQGVKRKGTAPGAEEVQEIEEFPLVRRKRPNLAFKERPLIANTNASDAPVPPQPTVSQPSSVIPPDTSVVTSSTKTDEQIAALQNLVITIMNNFTKQQAEIEALKAERIEREEKMKKLEEENAATKTLLLEEISKRQQLERCEQRLKIVEDCYDRLRSQMTLDADGYYRDPDYVDDPVDDAPRIEGATSGAGPSVSSSKAVSIAFSRESDWPALQQILLESGEIEEGEIFEPTKEQIAEYLGMDPNSITAQEDLIAIGDMSASSSNPDEEADEIIIEDVAEKSFSTSQMPEDEDLPDLSEFFKKNSEDELKRKINEKAEKGKTPVREEAEEANKEKTWKELLKEMTQGATQASEEPKYAECYEAKGGNSAGRILSWAYLDDLNVFAVRREKGVDYFKRGADLKSLPYYDMKQLARLSLLYSKSSGFVAWMESRIRLESKTKWNVFQPQAPVYFYDSTRINPVTQQPLRIEKYNAVQTMKRAPLRKMPQNWHSRFQWWCYDGRKHEAVIVLKEKDKWDSIRMIDPQWIRNFSAKDIEKLYKYPIAYNSRDKEQALQFDRVVRICYACDFHA